MSRPVVAPQAGRVVRQSVLACAFAAAAAVFVGGLAGHLAAGGLLAIGALIGAGNIALAQRLAATGVPFGLTSLMRLVAITAAALVAGAALGFTSVWLVVMGVAGAELILSLHAFRELTRR